MESVAAKLGENSNCELFIQTSVDDRCERALALQDSL